MGVGKWCNKDAKPPMQHQRLVIFLIKHAGVMCSQPQGQTGAIFPMSEGVGIPYEIRTRVAAVKGRCPRPLDERDNEPTRIGLVKSTVQIKPVFGLLADKVTDLRHCCLLSITATALHHAFAAFIKRLLPPMRPSRCHHGITV